MATLTLFLDRTTPDSRQQKPTCINTTKIAHTNIHNKSIFVSSPIIQEKHCLLAIPNFTSNPYDSRPEVISANSPLFAIINRTTSNFIKEMIK